MTDFNEVQREPGIEVTVEGAVRRPGRRVLTSPVTLAAALLAAGGVAQTRRMWASGEMTIRRTGTENAPAVWQYDLSAQGAVEWGQLVLQAGDVVTLSWHIKD